MTLAVRDGVRILGHAPATPFAGLEDAQVVQAFLDGHERAFDELVSRYQTRLLNFI